MSYAAERHVGSLGTAASSARTVRDSLLDPWGKTLAAGRSEQAARARAKPGRPTSIDESLRGVIWIGESFVRGLPRPMGFLPTGSPDARGCRKPRPQRRVWPARSRRRQARPRTVSNRGRMA